MCLGSWLIIDHGMLSGLLSVGSHAQWFAEELRVGDL